MCYHYIRVYNECYVKHRAGQALPTCTPETEIQLPGNAKFVPCHNHSPGSDGDEVCDYGPDPVRLWASMGHCSDECHRMWDPAAYDVFRINSSIIRTDRATHRNGFLVNGQIYIDIADLPQPWSTSSEYFDRPSPPSHPGFGVPQASGEQPSEQPGYEQWPGYAQPQGHTSQQTGYEQWPGYAQPQGHTSQSVYIPQPTLPASGSLATGPQQQGSSSRRDDAPSMAPQSKYGRRRPQETMPTEGQWKAKDPKCTNCTRYKVACDRARPCRPCERASEDCKYPAQTYMPVDDVAKRYQMRLNYSERRKENPEAFVRKSQSRQQGTADGTKGLARYKCTLCVQQGLECLGGQPCVNCRNQNIQVCIFYSGYQPPSNRPPGPSGGGPGPGPSGGSGGYAPNPPPSSDFHQSQPQMSSKSGYRNPPPPSNQASSYGQYSSSSRLPLRPSKELPSYQQHSSSSQQSVRPPNLLPAHQQYSSSFKPSGRYGPKPSVKEPLTHHHGLPYRPSVGPSKPSSGSHQSQPQPQMQSQSGYHNPPPPSNPASAYQQYSSSFKPSKTHGLKPSVKEPSTHHQGLLHPPFVPPSKPSSGFNQSQPQPQMPSQSGHLYPPPPSEKRLQRPPPTVQGPTTHPLLPPVKAPTLHRLTPPVKAPTFQRPAPPVKGPTIHRLAPHVKGPTIHRLAPPVNGPAVHRLPPSAKGPPARTPVGPPVRTPVRTPVRRPVRRPIRR